MTRRTARTIALAIALGVLLWLLLGGLDLAIDVRSAHQ